MRQISRVLLLLSLLFLPAFTLAESACSAVLLDSWEITSRVQKNKFVTGRGLWDYKDSLPKDFAASLQKLRPNQHWVDLGAGKAKAQIEYLKSFSNVSSAAQTTAVAYKLDRWFKPPNFKGKLVVREGAFESHDVTFWQKADLITDVFGVLSYTHDMHTSLQKVFDLLKVEGELYIFVSHPSTSFHLRGESLSMIEFLSSIEGLRVEGFFGRIKVVKERESIQVPVLKLREVKDDAPPLRDYEVLVND